MVDKSVIFHPKMDEKKNSEKKKTDAFSEGFPKLMVSIEPAVNLCTTLNINLNNRAVKNSEVPLEGVSTNTQQKKISHLANRGFSLLMNTYSNRSYCYGCTLQQTVLLSWTLMQVAA